jgi:hypothetical protein
MPVHWLERMRVDEQLKARLDEQEAKLNGAECKAHVGGLIEAGGSTRKVA